jgi:hypothetical protein
MKELLFVVVTTVFLSSCTLSFQNIETHGMASDLIDENQDASPEVSADITVPPFHPLPGFLMRPQ